MSDEQEYENCWDRDQIAEVARQQRGLPPRKVSRVDDPTDLVLPEPEVERSAGRPTSSMDSMLDSEEELSALLTNSGYKRCSIDSRIWVSPQGLVKILSTEGYYNYYPKVRKHGNKQYNMVWITHIRRWMTLGKLVLETFVGPAPSSRHGAYHKNLNSVDDRLENLEWRSRDANL